MSENKIDFIPVSELGTKGLTWDWSKMELNKKYFVSISDVKNSLYLLDLNRIKLIRQAEIMNAALVESEAISLDGWYFTLVPKETLSSKPLQT